MVSPTKCVMLLAFFLGLVLNVAGLELPGYGEECKCPEGKKICIGPYTCLGDMICYKESIHGESGICQFCMPHVMRG